MVVRSITRASVKVVLARALPIMSMASEQPMSTAYQNWPAVPYRS